MVPTTHLVVLAVLLSQPGERAPEDRAEIAVFFKRDTTESLPTVPVVPRRQRRKVTIRLDDAGNPIRTPVRSGSPLDAVQPVSGQAEPGLDPAIVPPPPRGGEPPLPELPPMVRYRSIPSPGLDEQEQIAVPRLITCYQPLYFEDNNLERFGCQHHACLQPVVSGVHFFGSVGLWPLKMLGVGPCQTVCPLDDEPEGHCLPRMRNLFGPTPRFDDGLRVPWRR